MGCGKSKHAVATASAPTAVARKKSAIKKSDKSGDTSKNSAAPPRQEHQMTTPPPREQDLSIDNNGNAAAVEAKQEAEPGKLISRESPSLFFSSHKDVELIAAAIADADDDGGSEYGSPRAESTGRDDSPSEWSGRDTAEDGGEKAAVGVVAVVEKAGETPAAVVVVQSEAPETKQQQQNEDDLKAEEGKLEGSSAAETIGKAT